MMERPLASEAPSVKRNSSWPSTIKPRTFLVAA